MLFRIATADLETNCIVRSLTLPALITAPVRQSRDRKGADKVFCPDKRFCPVAYAPGSDYNPMRRSRSWKRGSECSGSSIGIALSHCDSVERSGTFSNHSRAWSLSPRPA